MKDTEAAKLEANVRWISDNIDEILAILAGDNECPMQEAQKTYLREPVRT